MKKILFCLICSLFLIHTSFANEAHSSDQLNVEPYVNINTAAADQIAATLDGVGRKKAEAIVHFRESYGAFVSADGLVDVKGIGKSTVEKNRHRIRTE